MWGWIIALLSGTLMSVQGVFNTGVTKQTSTWLASAWVALSGFVVAIVLWACFERNDAQLIVAYAIELLGWFGVEKADFEWTKLIGMLLAIAGFIVFKWENK